MMTEAELFEKMKRELYTGLVCDVMDSLGYRNQAMHCRIRPLEPDNCKIAGRPRPFWQWMCMKWKRIHMKWRSNPLIPSSRARCRWYVRTTAPTTACGAVCCLLLPKCAAERGRSLMDLPGTPMKSGALDFPVFCAGYMPLDSNGRGKVIAMDCAVVVGGIRVRPGDVVFADFDGVVIIPAEIFDRVVELSFEKREKESHTKRELLEGKLLAEVYAKYGVL